MGIIAPNTLGWWNREEDVDAHNEQDKEEPGLSLPAENICPPRTDEEAGDKKLKVDVEENGREKAGPMCFT